MTLIAWLLLGAFTEPTPAGSDSPVALILEVDAGASAREETPVTARLAAPEVPACMKETLKGGPRGLAAREVGGEGPTPVQVEAAPDGSVTLTWILSGKTAAGTRRTFRVPLATDAGDRGPWTWDRDERSLRLRHGGRDVFRYNTAPVSDPNYPPIQARDAYIGPAFTPAGELITGDFSKFHTHHRGFFLAYTHTKVGAVEPDFWNIQSGTGKIVHEALESHAAGPVVARFRARHRWEAKGQGPVLNETWDVAVYDIPGRPYWLFDLVSTQAATDEPMELLPYRYGGMAYRGPEPFVKGPLDVRTDGGSGRLQRDQQPAKWVDLTGPVADGSDRYGGAMILDHPRNPHHPTVARIHPTLLPFFCYVPAHDEPLTIAKDRPTTFRYRIAIHDGRPDAERNERLWRDFAEPPTAVVRVVND